MKKKIISLLVIFGLTMICSCTPGGQENSQDASSDNISESLESDKTSIESSEESEISSEESESEKGSSIKIDEDSGSGYGELV